LSELAKLFLARNFKETIKEAQRISAKVLNTRLESKRNILIEITKYYLDAAFELSGYANLIE
jgi:hypothetical protein